MSNIKRPNIMPRKQLEKIPWYINHGWVHRMTMYAHVINSSKETIFLPPEVWEHIYLMVYPFRRKITKFYTSHPQIKSVSFWSDIDGSQTGNEWIYNIQGKLVSKIPYFNGLKDGRICSGTWEATYWRGMLHGYTIHYRRVPDEVKRVTPFVNGEKDGCEYEWGISGRLKRTSTYISGTLETQEDFYGNGQKRKRCCYGLKPSNDTENAKPKLVRINTEKKWWSNGTLWKSTPRNSSGDKHGTGYFVDPQGRIMKITRYEDGKKREEQVVVSSCDENDKDPLPVLKKLCVTNDLVKHHRPYLKLRIRQYKYSDNFVYANDVTTSFRDYQDRYYRE